MVSGCIVTCGILHAAGLLERLWVGWNFGRGRLGVVACFRDVWQIAPEGPVPSVWRLCLGQPRGSKDLPLGQHAG